MNNDRTRSKIEEDNVPFRLRIKKYRMLFSYHVKKLRNRISVGYFIFLVNIILFCFVLIPNLAHRLPIPGNWPMVLELRGAVLVRGINDLNESISIPVSSLKIEIGGYCTITNSKGEFDIAFSAQTYTIPVIFHSSNGTIIRWIHFQQGQFQKEEVFILE